MNLEMALRSLYVQRWTIVNVSRPQSVAEHQYATWLIATELRRALFDDTDDLFNEDVLTHDLHEVLLGDLPSTAKEFFPAEALDNAQTQARSQMGLRPLPGHGTVPWFIMKLADTLDAMLYAWRHLNPEHDSAGILPHIRQSFHSLVATAGIRYLTLPWDRVWVVARGACADDGWPRYLGAPLGPRPEARDATPPPPGPGVPPTYSAYEKALSDAVSPAWVVRPEALTIVTEEPSEPQGWGDILGRAHTATRERPAKYGTPEENYGRMASAINAVFGAKIKKKFTASDCALMMAILKICRQAHAPMPDNMVDLAGYAEVVAQIERARARAERDED